MPVSAGIVPNLLPNIPARRSGDSVVHGYGISAWGVLDALRSDAAAWPLQRV